MSKDYKTVSLEDVLHFFIEEIDGMGRNDGHPRNQGLPPWLSTIKNWKLRELTEDEFMCLLIPDGTNTLLKDKEESGYDSDLKLFVENKIKILNSGENLPPLIIRDKLSHETIDFSFYIEDGAHRAIALKDYFKDNGYKPVKAYIGSS